MKLIDSNLQCPSCSAPLVPKVLCCESCKIQVEGPFRLNEFATLAAEDLHFLRIFVQCEGRIRDMQPALGLSYPTIRSRLAQLKTRLGGPSTEPAPRQLATPGEDKTASALAQLEQGKITFDEALSQIKNLRRQSPTEK